MMEKNKLSAFFDGEKSFSNTEKNQWLNSLNEDAENLELWKSYTLTRDIMRDSNEKIVDWDISAKVSQALISEPIHQSHSDIGNSPAEVAFIHSLDQPTPAEVKKTLPLWLQQFAQFGTAAAVSVVVILGVQHYNVDNAKQVSSNKQPPVLQTIPLSGEAAPVSLNTNTMLKPDETKVIEQRQRINEFFQDFELQRRLNAMDLEKVDQKEPIE